MMIKFESDVHIDMRKDILFQLCENICDDQKEHWLVKRDNGALLCNFDSSYERFIKEKKVGDFLDYCKII